MAMDDLRTRQNLRTQTRAVLGAPGQLARHLARLDAALALDGAEPAQGALADLFHVASADAAPMKRAALQLAGARLAPHLRDAFAQRVAAGALPRVTPLATRWSVLAVPSADVSTRSRRVSADDSRALAAGVAQAVRDADMAAQEAFLHHCVTCQDALAFMLASRAARREGITLAPAWDRVAAELEQVRQAETQAIVVAGPARGGAS